jgi:hypothetical protein
MKAAFSKLCHMMDKDIDYNLAEYELSTPVTQSLSQEAASCSKTSAHIRMASFYLLGSYSLSVGELLPAFRRNVVPSSSWCGHPNKNLSLFLRQLVPCEGITNLRNVGNYLTNDTCNIPEDLNRQEHRCDYLKMSSVFISYDTILHASVVRK